MYPFHVKIYSHTPFTFPATFPEAPPLLTATRSDKLRRNFGGGAEKRKT